MGKKTYYMMEIPRAGYMGRRSYVMGLELESAFGKDARGLFHSDVNVMGPCT